jgi:hypothetical protein
MLSSSALLSVALFFSFPLRCCCCYYFSHTTIGLHTQGSMVVKVRELPQEMLKSSANALGDLLQTRWVSLQLPT